MPAKQAREEIFIPIIPADANCKAVMCRSKPDVDLRLIEKEGEKIIAVPRGV